MVLTQRRHPSFDRDEAQLHASFGSTKALTVLGTFFLFGSLMASSCRWEALR